MRRSAASIFGCASVLLSYPDEANTADLPRVHQTLQRLPGSMARSRLELVCQWLAQMAPMEAAARYVETFDLSRGVSLELTYYRHGDTRERGMALAALAGAYRAAGFGLSPTQLPDFLPALLEFAAVDTAGAALLGEHRMALDALHGALEHIGSTYAETVAALRDVLPSPTRSDRAALARYRDQGPPSEHVGLEPFAPPEVIASGLSSGAARQ